MVCKSIIDEAQEALLADKKAGLIPHHENDPDLMRAIERRRKTCEHKNCCIAFHQEQRVSFYCRDCGAETYPLELPLIAKKANLVWC